MKYFSLIFCVVFLAAQSSGQTEAETQMNKHPDDPQMLGNLHFFSARITYNSDVEKTKEHLQKAKVYFGKVYEKNHKVFEVIDQTLSELK